MTPAVHFRCCKFLNRRLQLYYRHTAREVRRLDSLALSPVYCAFGEATHAAVSIRAFGVQSHFSQTCQRLIGTYQRASLTGGWPGVSSRQLAYLPISLLFLPEKNLNPASQLALSTQTHITSGKFALIPHTVQTLNNIVKSAVHQVLTRSLSAASQ